MVKPQNKKLVLIAGCALFIVLALALCQLSIVSHAAEETLDGALDFLDMDDDEPLWGKHHKDHKKKDKKKVGAGFMLVTPSGKLLLLKRRSKHHGDAWGLPGGNLESTDAGDLVQTAVREAVEELGVLPTTYSIQGSFVTLRGKRKQKQYTVYVALVPDDAAEQYKPQLDPEEHSAWAWYSLSDLSRVHDKLMSSSSSGGGGGGGGQQGDTQGSGSAGKDGHASSSSNAGESTQAVVTTSTEAAPQPAGIWQHFVDVINEPRLGMVRHDNSATPASGPTTGDEGSKRVVDEGMQLHPVVMLALGSEHLGTVKQLITGTATTTTSKP